MDDALYHPEEVVNGQLLPPLTKAQLIAHCEGDAVLAQLLFRSSGHRNPIAVLAEAGGQEAFLYAHDAAQLRSGYGLSAPLYRLAVYRGEARIEIQSTLGFDALVERTGTESVRARLEAIGDAMIGAARGRARVSFTPASAEDSNGSLPALLLLQPRTFGSATPAMTVFSSTAPTPAGVLALVQFANEVFSAPATVSSVAGAWLAPGHVIARNAQLHARLRSAAQSAASAGYHVEQLPASEVPHSERGMERFRFRTPRGICAGWYRSEAGAWLGAIGDYLGPKVCLAFYADVLNGKALVPRTFGKAGATSSRPSVGTVLHIPDSDSAGAMIYCHLDDTVYHAAAMHPDARALQVGQSYVFAPHPDRPGTLRHEAVPLAIAQTVAADLRAVEGGTVSLEPLPTEMRGDGDGLTRIYVRTDSSTAPVEVGFVDTRGAAPILRARPLDSWAQAERVAAAGVPLDYAPKAISGDRPAVELGYLQMACHRKLGLWSSELLQPARVAPALVPDRDAQPAL